MTDELKDTLILALGRVEGKVDIMLSAFAGYDARFCAVEDRLRKVEIRAAIISAVATLLLTVLGQAVLAFLSK